MTDVDASGYSGFAGEKLLIQAQDQTGVVAVTVTISEITGVLIEQGAAIALEQPNSWSYAIQANAPAVEVLLIHVTASDRAGNSATKSLFHAFLPPGS